MPFKIVCIIESLGPGGAERQIAYLASLLKRAGEDVELWTYYPNDFYKAILDDGGVPYRCIDAARNKYRRVFVIKRLLRKHNTDAVIAYLDTCSMMMCVIKLLGARFRLIVSERSHTLKQTFRTRIKYLLYRKADAIVPNSFSETNQIKKNAAWLDNRITTIVNYIDTDKFIPSTGRFWEDGILRLIGVGRISDAKNLLLLAEAVAAVNRGKCVVSIDWFGDTTDKTLREKLVGRIGELGIKDKFVLHPQVTQIERFYPAYEALCLPSVYEGFPNVVCEAMSCGLPIICSNVCDNGFLVEDGTNGVLFDPNSSEEIANAFLRYMKEMRCEREGIRERNREKIKSICSKDVFVKQYLQLIYGESIDCR